MYSYEYDLAGHIKSITDALGNKERYEYDELGRLELKSDREGYDTRYVYGKNGKACEIRYGDGNIVKMSYTPLRQLAEIEDWLGKTQFIRNRNNKVEQVVDHRGQAVQYLYGDRGECNSIVYPDGSKVSYEYDEFMRLKKLSFGEESVKYFYSGENLARKIYSNGVESTYQYDYADRISRITYQMDNRNLEDYQYKYDLYGNKIQTIKTRAGFHEDSGKYNYEYNALNRLIKVYQNNELIRSYEYDDYGNRIRKWDRGKEIQYSYNEANQLMYEMSPEETKEYTYDLRGNIKEIKKNGIAEKQYKFNAMNQLEKAVNGEGGEAIYSYNGMGYRVGKKIIDNEVKDIHYLVNQTTGYNNRLGEDENGKIYKYIWDESIVCIENHGINSFVLTDEAGIPVRAMTKTGNTEEIFAMDEYGVRQKARNKSPVSFGISGYMEDEISGTFYAQVREYVPQLGRFLSEDKIGGNILFPLSFNQYDYCLGNPLIFIDLTGLFPVWLLILFAKGRAAHKAVESYAVGLSAMEGGEGFSEVYVKYGLDTKSGSGKIDIVYVKDGKAEVYEVKKESETSRFLGPFQAASYVFALKLDSNVKTREKLGFEKDKVELGSSLDEYFDNAIINSPYDPSVRYVLNTDGNGVIYYKEISAKPKPKLKAQEVVVNALAMAVENPKVVAGFQAGVYMTMAGVFYLLGAALVVDDATVVGIADDGIAAAAFVAAVFCTGMAISKLIDCAKY